MARFRGGPDPDVYVGSGADDLITGAEGDDTLSGRGGQDTIRGNSDNDQLRGGRGDDLLSGGSGADRLEGGGGNDTFLGSGGADTIRGGRGIDIAIYTNAQSGVTVDLSAGGPQDTGSAGVDTLQGVENLRGSSFNDSLHGDRHDNELLGGNGDDLLQGGRGNDTLDGGLGGDTLVGGVGADVFRFGSLQFASDSPTGLIRGLSSEDTIDLAAIDADITQGGDQAFTLVTGFSHTAGELTRAYSPDLGVTLAQADVDGDGQTDYVFYMSGDKTEFTNFVL